MSMRPRFREHLAGLPPAYFSLVMATGIVAIAAHLEEWDEVAHLLSYLNLAAFAALWVLFGLRLAWFPREVGRDLGDFRRAPGFFTEVAGTSVVGSQFVIIHQRPEAALVAWLVALPLWFVVTYGVFSSFTTADRKPALGAGIDGGWLTAVVATQSIAVLGTLIAPSLGEWRVAALFVSLVAWLQGGMLYFLLIGLIFHRWMFFEVSPSDLTPPYWINMGAMAISTLSGALLVEHEASMPLLAGLMPFLEGVTLFFWATATWWIPLLVVLGYWRHVMRGLALTYDPLYWGAVFPLGMYAVATTHVAGMVGTPSLLWIPHVFVYVALSAWALAGAGLLGRLWRLLRPSR
jgi:tellurite resistance protein TehA-like permease